MGDLEYANEGDEFFDYCLYKYIPNSPVKGKFLSSNLIFNSFEVAGVNKDFDDLTHEIIKAIGKNKTVWGVKLIEGKLFWEYYFYDYNDNKDVTMSVLFDGIKNLMDKGFKPDENVPYFMFSIDIDEGLFENGVQNAHVYLDSTPDKKVSPRIPMGTSFLMSESGLRLENMYYFYDPNAHMKQIMHKLKTSARLSGFDIDVSQVFWEDFTDCRSICLANKAETDCIYYSGINIEKFIVFLKKLGYPDKIVSFVEDNKDKLDHMKYDVGIDYKVEGGKLKIMKSGYYGTF